MASEVPSSALQALSLAPPLIYRLPDKLLSRIFHLMFPVSDAIGFIHGRNKALKNVCLVSQRFRTVAQPLLPECFVASTRTAKMIKTDERLKGQGKGVKTLVMVDYGAAPRAFDQLEAVRVLETCPAVEDLRFHGCHLVEPSNLAALAHLRTLLVSGTSISSVTIPIFPHVEEFTLRDCTMFLHTFEYLTKATTFPSLRNLNITMNVDLQRQPLPLPNDAALLRQLDVLVSDVPTALALADEHPSLTVIIETILGLPGTLFRPSVHWPSSYTAPIHIRVLPWKQFVPPPGPFYRLSEVTCIPPYTDLSDLLEWLVEEYPLDDKTKPVRLKSIDFPIKMYPTLQPNSRLEDVMERLVKALKRRGVKVGWSWREMTDGGIAPEMKKWVREEKARRRAPGVGVWR